MSKLAVSRTDQLVDRWTGRESIDRYGQPNTWTEMDRQIMHLQFPVVEFPPWRVVLPEVVTATDAC